MTLIMSDSEIMEYINAVSKHEANGHRTAQEVTTAAADMAIDLVAKFQRENAALVAVASNLKAIIERFNGHIILALKKGVTKKNGSAIGEFVTVLLETKSSLANLAAVRGGK